MPTNIRDTIPPSQVCVCVCLILTLEGPSQFEGIHVITTPLQCTHVYVHDRICLVVYDEESPWVGDIPKLDSSTTLSSLLSFNLKGPYHFEGVCVRTPPPALKHLAIYTCLGLG